MLLSFAVQTLAIAAVVIISIFTVDQLGAISLLQPMPPLPRMPKAMKIVASKNEAHAALSNLHVTKPFMAPARVPTSLPTITDGPEMAMAPAPAIGIETGVGDGIPGALDVIGSHTPVVTTAPPPGRRNADPPPPAKPIKVGGNVLEAKLVNRVMPVYPPLARQARISGTVRLEGIISRDGRVVNLRMISGHPLLINAAVEAVRQWVYRPTLLNGEAVEVIAPIDVHFTLGQ